MILQALVRLQDRHGYLPEDDLRALARELRVPLHRVHEVASFYPMFRRQPPPRLHVQVCRDMSCHLRGAPNLKHALEERAGADAVVEGVSCLGRCDQAPALAINHHIYSGLPEAEVAALVQRAAVGEALPEQPVNCSPSGWRIDPYAGQPTFAAVRRYLAEPHPADALRELEVANLRGMGGAGFPAFRKWAAVRGAAGGTKYVICNADESEPGTFKDRELLRRAPHLVVEGLLLAGLVTGAAKGIIYIRHEYAAEARRLEEVLAHTRRERLCGDDVLHSGHAFPVEVFVSPGGYIQGEESALLEALEDRRGEPRNKPPFPVTHGLFGKPTLINNVETLAWMPSILLHGGAWYRDAGVRGGTGLRLVSVSGDVNRPGVYEVPFGQTVGELLGLAGGLRDGQRLKALAPSGPSGGFLPARLPLEKLPPGIPSADLLDLPLDHATLGSLGYMLGGACVVYGDRADLLEQALNCTQFFRNESCGKCVPCRLGSQKLVDILGAPRPDSLPVIPELAEAMRLTSICGLGQVAANPITSLLRYFPEEVERGRSRFGF